MRRKFIMGAAILALLMNSPQVSAEDEIVIFGGEFEEETSKPAPKKVEKPQEPKPIEQPAQVEPQEIEQPAQVEPQEIEQPVQIEPQEIEQPVQIEPQEIEQPVQIEPQEIEQPIQLEPQEFDQPFEPPTKISNEWQERVEANKRPEIFTETNSAATKFENT